MSADKSTLPAASAYPACVWHPFTWEKVIEVIEDLKRNGIIVEIEGCLYHAKYDLGRAAEEAGRSSRR